MAGLTRTPTLSVIIPTLNEAEHLPLLLADINLWNNHLEIIIVDSGSSDLTSLIGTLNGAQVLHSSSPNRGEQLQLGAKYARANWLLFLHADSRMTEGWEDEVKSVISNKTSKWKGWFFNFKVEKKGLIFRLLEISVAIRSHLFNRPYGDQGLLINKYLYKRVGGFKSLPIMEDLDFITRLSSQSEIKSLGLPLYTNSRKWDHSGVILQAWKNARLRKRWREGEESSKLFLEYYE